VARHLLIVLSNAKPGREDEFNRWYSDVHIAETIEKLDGYASAQRYERADLPGHPLHPYKYIAIYEIEDDQLDRAFEQFRWQRTERADALAAGREPYLVVSDSMDSNRSVSGFFSPITDRLETGSNTPSTTHPEGGTR
jgi:hypothetical protein